MFLSEVVDLSKTFLSRFSQEGTVVPKHQPELRKFQVSRGCVQYHCCRWRSFSHLEHQPKIGALAPRSAKYTALLGLKFVSSKDTSVATGPAPAWSYKDPEVDCWNLVVFFEIN